MRLNRVGQCQQGQRALFRAGLRPAVEGMVGATHRRIDLGLGGFVDLCQGTAFSGVEHGPGRAIACDQATVDQHVGLHRGLLLCLRPAPGRLRLGAWSGSHPDRSVAIATSLGCL
ncbi:hypothetical protein D3C79_745580 [compost metagenome]